MDDLSGILAIWYREYKVFRREKSRIVASIVTPVLWLFIFGGGLGSSVTIPGTNYQAFIYPGILAQSVLFSSIFFGVYIVWDRKVDFLKEVLVAPVSRTGIFLGKVVGGATDSLIQAAILLLLGVILSRTGAIAGLRLGVGQLVPGALVLAVTTVAFVSVGLIIGSFMDSPEGFQLVSSFVVFPLFFLSGALFPIDRLPGWLAPFTFLDPLTYAVDALRAVMVGSSHFAFAFDLGVVTAFTVVIVAAGTRAFERMKV
ncbi:MAG: ABC transporter permease [Gemmatimonadota bacterium]|nr:ABC transporter permease [Gemmatimonadota bacterium]